MAAVAVDVHLVDVDALGGDLTRFDRLLSPQERCRALRFRFMHDRRRYVVRRAWVRTLLARRLGCTPDAVPIAVAEHGKPFVMDSDLRFNLSRSGPMALCVLADGAELGCDLERRDATLDHPGIARQFFSPREQAALQALPPARRLDGFFNGWTRKEAFVKATGCGLSLSLDSFDVSLAPDEPAALLRGAEGWSVASFEPSPGYQAAVVARGTALCLTLHPEAVGVGEGPR